MKKGLLLELKKGGKIGLFELANGGTIFLDEIGELPMYLQAKLLRVLQDNTIQRLGSIQPIPIDVRTIAATNQNIEEMIVKNEFRDDLYYRLNVIPIEIPPLRDRMGDVELLSYHFLKSIVFYSTKKINSISNECMEILNNYNWPGNIRELENAIEYAVNMEEKSFISKESLPKKLSKKIHINHQIFKKNSQREI